MESGRVSTLVVEWIEITLAFTSGCESVVSTLVVEWIEIQPDKRGADGMVCLHPRGGVD